MSNICASLHLYTRTALSNIRCNVSLIFMRPFIYVHSICQTVRLSARARFNSTVINERFTGIVVKVIS